MSKESDEADGFNASQQARLRREIKENRGVAHEKEVCWRVDAIQIWIEGGHTSSRFVEHDWIF